MGANRIIILVAIALLTIAVYSSASAKEIIAGNDPEANFSTIQEAVNNSSSGDVILVLPGIYNETLDVKVEDLSILSESENPEDTVVAAFIVNANNVTISGFYISGGIEGIDCFNCVFSGNFCSGISLNSGGELTNVTIANNTIKEGGLRLGSSSENRIINNTISNTISETEYSYGILFTESHSNYVANNHISGSKYGIATARLSSDNEIINNTLTSNYVGGSMTDVSRSNNISGNTIINNSIGIWEEYSWGNLITDNNVSLNKEYGVYLNKVIYEPPYTGTTLFYNNIFNNTVNVLNDTGSYYTADAVNRGAGIIPVVWNTTKRLGTSIAGGPYLGGNFWAKPDGTGFSQRCNDWDNDGICDSSYTISANDIDYLPLTVLPDQQLVFPVASFISNISSGYIPLSVQFTDLSQNASSRSWDFNQDGIEDSSDTNPVYTYTMPGTYTVNLTVSNANGTVSRLSAIIALPAPPKDGFTLKETQISTNKSNQTLPAIYGDRIVWLDDRNGSGYCNIYMYNLSTSREIRISTNNSYFSTGPAIYGDRIVWQEYRKTGEIWDKFDIHMYDLSTSRETQITNSGKAAEPAIYEDRIVWMDGRNGKYYDIYMYNISTCRETRITTNESHQSSPAIYGDIIVWVDSRNGRGYNPTDIYMYNLSTSEETQITADDSDQYSPAIYGDKIVWADSRNGKWDIYMYNLSTSTETRITTDASSQEFPAIYGNRLVWHDDRNGNYDIYMYNFSTQEEVQITTNGSDQIYPAIYENRIVWEDFRNGNNWYGASNRNSDIYMCTVLGKEPEQKPPVANFSANVTSGNVPLKVLFTDNSTGAPTSWLWDFGDGIYSKHAMNATHTFTKPGIYNITLTVSNAAGIDTVIKSRYVTVTALKVPVAAFTANVTSGKVPLVVKFTDIGTGGTPASWRWDFGDGIYSKHAMNATHTYTRKGTYDVILTVKNDAGSNTTKKTGYITVKSM
jgi:beta propeller repeat protein/parallel beta-helix repeat protein